MPYTWWVLRLVWLQLVMSETITSMQYLLAAAYRKVGIMARKPTCKPCLAVHGSSARWPASNLTNNRAFLQPYAILHYTRARVQPNREQFNYCILVFREGQKS
jgi:hypothetical protein